MEKYTMFMDQKNQYSENEYTTQSNLYIQCNSYQSAAAAAKSLQSCLTLCDPIDSSPPSSFVPGILQAKTLEWVAISFSNAWKWKVKVKSLSRVRLLATPRTAAYQAPLSMGFSTQEYWSGVPSPSPPWCSSCRLSSVCCPVLPTFTRPNSYIICHFILNTWDRKSTRLNSSHS